MDTIRLITCETNYEANLIKGRLANEGIVSFVTNENFTTMLPVFNGMLGAGVQVIIYKKDYLKASKALNLYKKAEKEKSVEIICPVCSSKNIEFGLGKNKFPKIVAVFLSLLFWIPFNNIRNNYYCKDCHTEFSGTDR